MVRVRPHDEHQEVVMTARNAIWFFVSPLVG
jgi:hypothetical protein